MVVKPATPVVVVPRAMSVVPAAVLPVVVIPVVVLPVVVAPAAVGPAYFTIPDLLSDVIAPQE